MTLRAVIVDDELLARRGLEIRLAEHDDVDIVASCRNGREALAAIDKENPDVLFLDIQMPGMDGFDVMAELVGPDVPHVVFVTAFDHFAVQAFEANAIDYLLKPIGDDRLHDALDKVRSAQSAQQVTDQRDRLLEVVAGLRGHPLSLDEALEDEPSGPRYTSRLAIRDGGQTTCVDVQDIEWIDAARDYMCIHANGKTHVLRGTMKNLEEKLDPNRFIRIHRSTIVNRDRVIALKPHRNGECFVSLDCGREFKLSRKYKSSVERIAERI
ncbi:MAG: LytTR family DNA-binding domain-containing protein [Pseudomonadota bacterium]